MKSERCNKLMMQEDFMKLKSLRVFILIPLLFLLMPSCGGRPALKGLDLKLEILPDTVTDFLYA